MFGCPHMRYGIYIRLSPHIFEPISVPRWPSSPSCTHSSLRKESLAELMLLTFIWDETASGTARSKTRNGLHS